MRDWKSWARSAMLRAVRTVAQTAVANIGFSAEFREIDWFFLVGTSLTAGLLSVLTSLAGLPEE